MALDILAAVVLISMVGLGYHKGALSQLAWLGGGVAALLGARPAGAVCAQEMYGQTALGEPLLDAAMMLLGGSIIYVLVAGVGLLFVRFLKRDKDKPSGVDRVGGALLGLCKAAAVVYLAAFGVSQMSQTLQQADPADRLRLRGSEVLRASAEAQPFVEALVETYWAPLEEPAPTASLLSAP
jgi:hypothetical protein